MSFHFVIDFPDVGTVYLLAVCVGYILWHPKSKLQFVTGSFNLMENIVPAIVGKKKQINF